MSQILVWVYMPFHKVPTNQGLISCLGKPTLLIQKCKQSQGFLEEHIQEWPIVLVLHGCSVNALIVIFHLEGNRMCISLAQNWPAYHQAALEHTLGAWQHWTHVENRVFYVSSKGLFLYITLLELAFKSDLRLACGRQLKLAKTGWLWVSKHWLGKSQLRKWFRGVRWWCSG